MSGLVEWLRAIDHSSVEDCFLQSPLFGKAADEITRLTARVAELEEVLAWYGEQARLARLIHSGGDAGRAAIADDGGKRAKAALESKP